MDLTSVAIRDNFQCKEFESSSLFQSLLLIPAIVENQVVCLLHEENGIGAFVTTVTVHSIVKTTTACCRAPKQQNMCVGSVGFFFVV